MGTNVSEQYTASIFRIFSPKKGEDFSSETFVLIYKSTRRHNPQDHHGYHRRENLKSRINNVNSSARNGPVYGGIPYRNFFFLHLIPALINI
jgi:hypothetical protein